MTTVRADRFDLDALVTSVVAVDVWTVPEGRRALVKSVRLINDTDAELTVWLWTGDDEVAGAIFRQFVMAPREHVPDWTGDVWRQGEVLRARVSAGGRLIVRSWGSLLYLPVVP